MDLEWRDIPGYVGSYQVSSAGDVRSLLGRSLRILKVDVHHSHLRVTLRSSGKSSNRYVHHLVALAFIGPRPDGLEVLHNNGASTDNQVENLRYGTPAANSLDAIRHGTHPKASRTQCVNGHDYTPENTRVRVRGGLRADGTPKSERVCLTCDRSHHARAA